MLNAWSSSEISIAGTRMNSNVRRIHMDAFVWRSKPMQMELLKCLTTRNIRSRLKEQMDSGKIGIQRGPSMQYKIKTHICMTPFFGTHQRNSNGLTRGQFLSQNRVLEFTSPTWAWHRNSEEYQLTENSLIITLTGSKQLGIMWFN